MKKLTVSIGILLVVLTSGCKEDKKTEEKVEELVEQVVEKPNSNVKEKLSITLQSKSGSDVSGNVTFIQNPDNTVKMIAEIKGLTPGTHAIHIHETADCSSNDGKSSGGHWNPTAQPHGKWGDGKGYHKGDIGNFVADENGDGIITKKTNEWCIGCNDKTKNIIGKAIIIHQGEDDLTSQPSGAAGKRVSCAGIIK